MRRIPCAAHRPPHQKGRRRSGWKCKSVVTAVLKALQRNVKAFYYCGGCNEELPASHFSKPAILKLTADKNLAQLFCAACRPEDKDVKSIGKYTFCDRFGLQNGPRFVPETLRGPLGALGRVSERSRDARGTLRRGFGDAPGRRWDAPGAPWDASGTLREASGHPKIEPSEPQEAFPTGF